MTTSRERATTGTEVLETAGRRRARLGWLILAGTAGQVLIAAVLSRAAAGAGRQDFADCGEPPS